MGECEPSAAEGEGFWGKGAEACGEIGQAWFAVFGDEDLPVRPAAVFEHAVGEPRGVCDRVDFLPVHIPEQVVGQGVHR